MTQPDATQIQRFFELLYPDVDDGYLVLSRPDPTRLTPQGKPMLMSDWFDLSKTTWQKIGQAGQRLAQHHNLYYGVVLQQPTCTPAEFRRSKNSTAHTVPGLWFDLDLAYGQHAASTLPSSDAEALDFLSTLPAQPSVIVHSGGGMYPFWLFKEPFVITTPEDHAAIAELSTRFAHTVTTAGAQQHGWDLDALGDLARILRPPGTINHKYGKSVELIHESNTRYNPSDFDWLLDLPTRSTASHAGTAIAGQPDLVTIAEHYGTVLTPKSQTELAGPHPQHGSSTGDNLNICPSKGLWHCWRHGTGGDALTLIAVCEGLLDCAQAMSGALKGDLFKRVVEIANTVHGAGIQLGKAAPSLVALKTTRTGTPRPVIFNILEVLTTDTRWSGIFGYDQLAGDATILQRPPYSTSTTDWQPRTVEDCDETETSNWLQREYDLCAPTALVGEGIQSIARRNPYHPICDYLAGLTWDKRPRLDTWLMKYCHAKDTVYTRAVGSKTLIAAVARVQEPGCKADTVPILEGDQGALKSTVWRVLASDTWFSDTLPDLANKDAAQALRGKWVVELGELAVLQRSEIEQIKRFISATQDHYRPSYGRRAVTFPRHNIFVGSTNKETYFKDETGNRRFWPVALTGLCDVDTLQRDRDQLWAEAYARYQAGEAWHLTADLEQHAIQEQARRVEPDDWEAPILHFIGLHSLTKVTTRQILTDCFHFENLTLWTQAHTKRIGGILRRNGWRHQTIRDDEGHEVKGYSLVTGKTGYADAIGYALTTNKNSVVTSVTSVTSVSGDIKISEVIDVGAAEEIHIGSMEVPVTSVTSVTPVTPSTSSPSIAVADWVFLLSVDGAIQNTDPYQVTAIEQGPDGLQYARFLENDTGWLVERCEKAPHPPRMPTNGTHPPGDGLPLSGAPPAQADACPTCGHTDWLLGVTSRRCAYCGHVDTPHGAET